MTTMTISVEKHDGGGLVTGVVLNGYNATIFEVRGSYRMVITTLAAFLEESVCGSDV